ncbi:MAG: hypothetical protein E7598_02280 [Ruminococcaceae bacterium]|nr:hypothetical protein [Oscillospiraceae bacterium]
MKKIFWVTILVFVLIFTFSAFAASDIVYVSASGDDNASGTSKEPLNSLYAAFRALPYGGTIVVCDEMKLESIEFPASKGNITITSVYGSDYRTKGAALVLSGNVYLKSSVNFKNLNIVISNNNINIVCNGNHTVFSKGVKVSISDSLTYDPENDPSPYPRITVGAAGLVGANGGYLEINSGTFSRIYGGSAGTNSAPHSGDTTIVINNGTFEDVFYMTGVTNSTGNTNIYIHNGTFKNGIVGAAVSGAEISGELYVSVYGGDFHYYIRPVTNGIISNKCTINIFGSNLSKVYGSETGTVSGELKINIASNVALTTCPYDTTPVSESSIAEILESDSANASAAYQAKYPAITENPLKNRDSSRSGASAKITKFEKEIPGGDVDADEKLSLLDVLRAVKMSVSGNYTAAADINEDKTISASDFLTILRSALSKGELITEYSVTNDMSANLSLFGSAEVNEGFISSGYAFGTANSDAYSIYSKLKLNENSVVGLYFGCDGNSPALKNGYYFEVNTADESLVVYKIINGNYRAVAERKLNRLSDNAEIKVVCGNSTKKNAVQLYFNDNPLVMENYFDFDLALTAYGNCVGIYTENAVASLPVVTTVVPDNSVETYSNHIITTFTDPEIFYVDGTYYIYGTKSGGSSNGVTCYSTTDFVNFTAEGTVLSIADSFSDKNITAANLVNHDGLYYMFYLQGSTSLGYSTTGYATSTSPTGPFKSEEKVPLTNETDLIGGQPFVDDDGTAYLIYTRTTGGNRTYISKLVLSNGKATLDLSTETLLLSPTEDWEYAKASVLECGYMVKHNGTYYLIYSGGNYNSTYGVGYATSDNIYGPYTKYSHNPIMWSNDQAYGNGAASAFSSPDGKEHFIIYLRNNSPTVTRPLNTCIDRIRFVPNPKGGNDILEIAGASVNPQPLPSGIGKLHDIDYQTSRWHW